MISLDEILTHQAAGFVRKAAVSPTTRKRRRRAAVRNTCVRDRLAVRETASIVRETRGWIRRPTEIRRDDCPGARIDADAERDPDRRSGRFVSQAGGALE